MKLIRSNNVRQQKQNVQQLQTTALKNSRFFVFVVGDMNLKFKVLFTYNLTRESRNI